MGIGEIFNLILIEPIFNLLLVFLAVFTTWGLPGSLGWAIVALTGFFRILFAPFYAKQMEMSAAMEELRPKLEKIQKKYKGNPQKIQQEQLKLYQERGINPASGCLVGLLQLPLVIALYRVLLMIFEKDNLSHFVQTVKDMAYFDLLKVTTYDPWFLGFNLGTAPSTYGQNGAHYLLIPFITAVLQYYQITLSQGKQPAKEEVKEIVDTKKKDKKSEAEQESFQAVFQKQMKFMFPLMIGYFSYILPVGLALYWNVFSLFSILQSKKRK